MRSRLVIDAPPTPPLSPLPCPLLTPVQPEYAADIAPPSSINPPSMLSLPPNSAACASSTMALAPTSVIPPSATTPAASTAASLCMIQAVTDPTAAPKLTHPAPCRTVLIPSRIVRVHSPVPPHSAKHLKSKTMPPPQTTSLDGQWLRRPRLPSKAQRLGLGGHSSLSCANESDAGGALGGDGSTATSSIACPPLSSNNNGDGSHDDEVPLMDFLQHQHMQCLQARWRWQLVPCRRHQWPRPHTRQQQPCQLHQQWRQQQQPRPRLPLQTRASCAPHSHPVSTTSVAATACSTATAATSAMHQRQQHQQPRPRTSHAAAFDPCTR